MSSMPEAAGRGARARTPPSPFLFAARSIGAGRIGLVHLEALASCVEAKPIIISNPTVSKAQKAAEMFNVPAYTASDMEVINNPDVDAVWICSPSQFHADQIKACAAAGKHVRAWDVESRLLLSSQPCDSSLSDRGARARLP